MQDFKCVTNDIYNIKKELDEIQVLLDETYKNAIQVQANLSEPAVWAGESQLVGAAFMDLVTQYHKLLAGDGAGPVKEASDGMQNYLDKDEVFYDEWSEYQEIKSM
ncbi:MAG: hypothetical protein Q4D94_09765 [Bacillota bacterium]|nr:hypothetical protein [Bacillota bacterium]